MRRVVAALFAVLLTAVPAAAQTPLKIMVGGIDKQIYLPAKLAAQLGFFKEEGLDVELFNSTSGSQAATALLAREVQGVVGFYDHTIDLQAKGKFITDVVQFSVAPGEVVLVKAAEADKLKQPANWKGLALGVTGLGSATDFLTRALAAKAGLKMQDYTLVPVGAGDTFLAAMQQGKISSGMTTEPTVQRALSSGTAKIGIDLRSPEQTRKALGGDYPAACLYMDRGWMEANKPTVQKLVNAFVKTLKWIQAHSAEEIADKMPKDYYAGDRALYVQGLQDGKVQYSPDGMMPAGAPESVAKILASFSPNLQGKTIDLAKTYTTEFVVKANAGQ
ncbi:putative substrate-binding component of ABC transporter [Rhodopseudomonas palustris TIE-1]|uniref:ABC transporter substrate-binding protein n=1 Tax=Rhodopseudomonas palustris TaxID=1076 RepID=UPI000164ABB5|nr:ABC transporter substrate-binding protein [Rhodopseudomonas palustris]ACE99509.1 putative substrate-binding component of ABC transporter [Rhodopseudomonas palustris TIE-1]